VNSQQFLILNAVILLVLIIWFLIGRRTSAIKPTQLRMKQGNARSGRYSDPKFQKYLEGDGDTEAPAVKELNVLFNYNGHTWDAYEVLGVPAGENIVAVTKAYQQLVKTSSPESQEFLETAFKSILAKK
jgi:DnaJ-domain-containing protein 1